MDKYAVDVEPKTKEAALPGQLSIPGVGCCPNCSSELEEGVNVPKCPKCGTRPFEKR